MKIVIRDPGSAITHFLAAIFTLIAAVPLLIKAAASMNILTFIAMIIFVISMVLLYSASTTYHSVTASPKLIKFFKKIDHMMIYVLIAGSYTPICLVSLDKTSGYRLFLVIWGLALVGVVITAAWVTCPKWFSAIVYIAMGWVCIAVLGKLFILLPPESFYLLLAGGIIYTVGGIIYALKLSVFNNKHKNFGSHEIFHLFVMGGSTCHFLCMYFIM